MAMEFPWPGLWIAKKREGHFPVSGEGCKRWREPEENGKEPEARALREPAMFQHLLDGCLERGKTAVYGPSQVAHLIEHPFPDLLP